MPIIINPGVVLAKRKMKSVELVKLVGITEQNLSILKTGKAKAIHISTLDAICQHLECQPEGFMPKGEIYAGKKL
jgi:putative transcriptional regulator